MAKKSKVINDYRRLVLKWNSDYPLDLWWRTKHNVAFGSDNHIRMDYIDMRLEYEEDKLLNDIRDKDKDEEIKADTGDKDLDSIINMSDKTKIVNMKEEDVDYEFDNLNIDQLDK